MNDHDELRRRVERMENALQRWRLGAVVVAAFIVASALASPAHALDRYLNLVSLSAESIDTRKLVVISGLTADSIETRRLNVTSEITATQVKVVDRAGKVRAVLSADDPVQSAATLVLKDAQGTRSATLQADDRGVELQLAGGEGRPLVTLESREEKFSAPGLSVWDGKVKRIELQVDPENHYSHLSLSAPDPAKGGASIQASEYSGGSLFLYGGFGSARIDTNSMVTKEPQLEIRAEKGSKAKLLLGIERGEPTASMQDSTGSVIWEPKPTQKASDQSKSKKSKKEPTDPF